MDVSNQSKVKGFNVPNTNQDPDVQKLAEEISRYLLEHDGVADTLEGVTQWWLLRQRLHEGRNKVARAIDYLCEQGVIERRELPDGKILYGPVGSSKDSHTMN